MLPGMKVNFDPGLQDPTAYLEINPLPEERVGERDSRNYCYQSSMRIFRSVARSINFLFHPVQHCVPCGELAFDLIKAIRRK